MYSSDRKTAGELRAIGEQRGWKARKNISAAELHGFSSLEMQFHEAFSPEALKVALSEPKRRGDDKVSSVKRIWTGGSTKEESVAAWEMANKFIAAHPQIPLNDATAKTFQSFFREHTLDPREYTNWATALDRLGTEGRIVLSPKAAGVGPEEILSGNQLKTYPKLYLLLQPAPNAETRKRRELYKPELSADEFIRQTPELQNGPSYAERQAIDLAVRSLPHFERDYVATEENGKKLLQYIHKNNLQFNLIGLRIAFNALKNDLELKSVTVQAGKTTMTNYEPRAQGAPKLPDKASLAAKIRNMSSNQLADFFRNNEGARKAVDAM